MPLSDRKGKDGVVNVTMGIRIAYLKRRTVCIYIEDKYVYRT